MKPQTSEGSFPRPSKPPTVSVIIAAFNAATTLRRAVDSVLSQNMEDYEIIIVDDGSDDDTYSVARDLAHEDDSIFVLRRGVRGGPSAARNAALAVARGTWIAPLDADDAYEPDRLERLTALADARDDDFLADNIALWSPETQRVVGLGYESDQLGRRSPLTLAGLLEDAAHPRGRRNLGFLKPIFRKAFLDERNLQYDDDLKCAEDWLLYAYALLAGARFSIIPEAYYLYSVHRDSLTQGRHGMVDNLTQLLAAGEKLERRIRAAGDGRGSALELLSIRSKRLTRLRRKHVLKKWILDRPALRALAYFLQGRGPDGTTKARSPFHP